MSDTQALTVAVLGASSNPAKYGNKAVRAHVQQGHRVHPVNPHAEEVAGIRAYRQLDDVPGPVDRVSVYLPPEVTLAELPAIAAFCERHGAAEVWLNPGTESDAVLGKARELGLNVIQACSILAVGAHPDAV